MGLWGPGLALAGGGELFGEGAACAAIPGCQVVLTVAAVAAVGIEIYQGVKALAHVFHSEGDNEPTAESPEIEPSEVAGKTPSEIDRLAKEKGLVPKGENPAQGKGAYVDPVTGKQRILSHPNANPPHCHVNNCNGERLDINGKVVAPESPEAHLPAGG